MIIIEDLQDIQDFDIKSLDSLESSKRAHREYRKTHWQKLEQRIREQGKAPSLPAYLLHEYIFKYRTLRDLASELGSNYQSLLNLMNQLGIPSKNQIIYLQKDKPNSPPRKPRKYKK